MPEAYISQFPVWEMTKPTLVLVFQSPQVADQNVGFEGLRWPTADLAPTDVLCVILTPQMC